MNNSRGMGSGESFGSVLQKPQQLSQFSSLLMDLFSQSEAIDEFHRNEVHPVVLANLVAVGNVGMVERGGSGCLLFKSPHPVLIRSQLRGQDFQCDLAVEPRVFGQVNFAHTALAELRADFVTAEFCAGGKCHAKEWASVRTGSGSDRV